jgi:DNA-binding GntR family transcriptional regulator
MYPIEGRMLKTRTVFEIASNDQEEGLLTARVQPISLVNDVAERFRRSVINGTLKPGEEINELQLSERLDVSRGTLREAIRILVGEGLLEKLPNRKARVRTLTPTKFWEIMTTRAVIEGFAARLLAQRLTPEKLARLNEIWQRIYRAAETNDRALFSNWDFAFHQAIMEMSGHELLLETWTKISAWILLMFAAQDHTSTDMMPNALNHQKIIEAIASGDPEVAENKLKTDLLDQPEFQRMSQALAQAQSAPSETK